MAELATISNQSITSKNGKLKQVMNFFMNTGLRQYVILGIVGLLLGRAIILDFLNPFCTAFLAAAMIQELNPFVMGISILLGVLSIGNKGVLLKCIFVMLAFIILNFATLRIKTNKRIVISIVAALANFMAGYFIFYVQNYYLYDFLMVLIESFLIVLLIYIYDR